MSLKDIFTLGLKHTEGRIQINTNWYAYLEQIHIWLCTSGNVSYTNNFSIHDMT